MPLLDIQDLKVQFFTDEGIVRAVDGLSFSIEKGKTLGIVGESGCGKSMTALAVMRLIPPPGKIVSGKIIFNNQNLLDLSDSEMHKIRGGKISVIFQDPMTSLNPVFTIGDQISEAIQIHQRLPKQKAKEKAIQMLEKVKIPNPVERCRAYPHQLSGGMRQRAMIAMALSCNPSLLIADEPTTALDVTVQAQILDLMKDLQKEFQTSIILITHNLGIVADVCEDVMVMYAGRAVEKAPSQILFKNPKHPYTAGLLTSLPRLDETQNRKLIPIDGQPPVLKEKANSCTFAPRCKLAVQQCFSSEPDLKIVEPNHLSRCILFDKVKIQAEAAL
jgi:oligopeptide/dipeptide ABC transporter ATP-binding protein